MEYEASRESRVASHEPDQAVLLTAHSSQLNALLVWLVVSPPDAIWKAPYSARFHGGASVPGG